MKQTINKRLTLWLLTLALAAAALPALTAPAQAAKTPVDVVFGSETVTGEKEKPYGTTFVYCENVSYSLEKPDSNDPYYAAYTTWATGDIRIADTVDGKEVRKIRSGFGKELTGKVTLGKNINSLDYSVFSGGKLREVTIPEGSNLKRICQYAFRACPNLVRVGVGNTDKLPASVTDIDYYAFYESPAIKSIDLTQTKVKSIDDCTFTDCTALTSVKLPDDLTSIGHSAFKGCTALTALDVPASVQFIGMDTFSYSGITDLKLRCGAVSPAGMSIARSLLAMPDGATVYLPKPSTAADYEKAMQFIYGDGRYTNCGANAKVKVYWLDSNTGPVAEPSAKNNNVVTLSGKDKDKKPVTFNYDYTDADGDGLGAVIRLSGRQNGATLKLTLNGSGTTDNTNAVIFTRVRAYDSRHQGNIDSEAYSGKKLTDLLLRQQAVNYSSSINNSPQELSLALGNSDKLGLYYFIPTLVNKGSTSQPMNAKTLPPVLVVYTPTDGADEGVGLETSFGSSNKWFCGNGDKVNFDETGLPGAYPLYADGFEACFGTESDALKKGNAAYFDNGQNSIIYQWKRVNKDGTSVLETISASNYDYSRAGKKEGTTAAATFNCYENILPRGLQYCIGGLSGSYLQNLYNSSGVGTYYFQPTITVKVNGKVSKSVTGPIQSITFYRELTFGDPRVTVNYDDSGTGNVTGPNTAPGAPYDSIKLYTLKRNTINALAAPQTNLWGLDGKSYDGTIVYDWYYYKQKSSGSGNGPSTHFKDAGPNLPLNQLAKEEPGRYTLYCTISVRNGKGDTVLKSWTDTSGYYCWVDVLDANADYPASMPSFDNFPKAIYFDLNYQSGTFKIPAPGTNMFAGSFSTRKLELFEVDSRDQNRGGELRISGTVKMDNDGEFARISNINTPSVDKPYVFPDFKARWCYYKYTLTDSAGKTYVVYSPTVAVQPSLLNPPASGQYFAVYRYAAMPEKVEVKVTGQPYSEYWLPNTGNVTLTAELETKNYPLIYRDSRRPIFKWYSVDAGKNLTANANFAQSVRIDSADIDADGNLLLKGALSATFRRGSGSSDDYFDPTLPDGTPVSANDRKFDLRGAILVSGSNITWTPSNPTDPLINTVTIHPTTVSVAAPTASVTGGRMVPVWNGDTGKYGWGAAPAGEFAENEYRLFSERFDGKAEGQYGNIPKSPEPVKITATTNTSGATIRWRVTVSDGTGNVLSTTELKPGTASVTYDSAAASNGYSAYTDKATAAWTSSSNSTLTVAIPTGAEARKLTVQPMAVKTNSGQITGLTYGDVYEVYTNRAAKATTPTISNVYNGAPTYQVSRDQLAKAENTFVFASPNIWVGTGGRGDTTYRWYLSRTADERSVDISAAIPLSEEMTVSGAERDYSGLSLTAELLRQHCAKIGDSYNDTLYIYAYAQNYDPSATQVQYAEKLMKVCEVVVADFYAMSPVLITPAYNGTDTVDIFYGQKAPEEMFSITIPLPADKTRYSVRLRGEAKSPDGTFVEDKSSGSAAILRDDSAAAGAHSGYEQRGNYYVYIPERYNLPQMTVTIDPTGNTATFTVDQRYFPCLVLTSIYVSGSGYESADMDFDFYWYVYGEYFGSENTATGGDRTETTGKKYTVHRRQYPLSLTNLSFYSGTEASYSDATPTDTAFWGGESPAATLPGFRQHSSGYGDTQGLRPVTVTVGSSDATWVLVRMEYWNETNKRWEKLVNSSLVSVTGGETLEYKDGSTTYTLVKPGSTVSLLTGPGAYFGGSAPRFLRIAAYPMGVNAFADTQDTLTGYDRITPAKQIFVVQPLTGEVVDAAKPVCSDSSSFENFTFIARDSSMTKHTFGADAWTVSDNGTLSYQWKFHNDKTGEYETIAGATDPTLTVNKEQVRTWCEHNGKPYTSLKLEVTNTNTDPKITGNRYVTEESYTTVYYQDSAVTPRVKITSDGNTTFNLGETGGTLTGTVSNLTELNNPSYAWGCRVTRAVGNDDKVYDAPADTAFRYLSKDNVAGADTDTLKLYALNGGNDYNIDGSWYSMSSGWKCLWDSYKEVTIEYQLAVTENFTSGSSTTYATGTSNSISVTIKRPEQVTALSVTQNGTHPVPPYVLRDDNPLTFTAPEVTGSAPRSYNWARSWEAAAGSDNYSTVENWTEPTLVLTKDDYWSSSPYILCVMTDTYTDPNSGKTLELKTESDRILVHYIGENAGKPLFTAGNQVVVADPGAKGESFDGSATSPDFGTITYKWEMVDRVTGKKTALSEKSPVLNLDPYTAETGAWYFTCTATNTRTTDGKSASGSWSYELYIRGVTLTAELPEVDAVAEESSEVKLTATAFGLHGGNFAWTNTGATEWTLKDVKDGNWYSNFVTLTATAVAAPTASSSDALNTTVTFSCTPGDGSAVKTAFVNLKANVKNFMVAGDPIELTVDEAVPAGTKLTHKGSVTPDTWSVVSYDGLDAAGVTVNPDGTLSGTPTVPGPYRMTVKATKGTTTATSIVTVYVKIPKREGISNGAMLSVGTNTSLDVSKNHSGGGWSWDTRTGVLTLDNYTGEDISARSFDGAPLYIRLKGSSSLTEISGDYSKGTVLCGSGDLTVSGGSYLVKYDLDVRGSGKIKLIGTGQNKSAVYGKLTVGEQGDVEITSSVDGYTAIEGTLAVNGGKLNITLTGARSKGIVQNSTVTEITGGTATITVKGSHDCRGISGGGVEVSGGKLTVDVEILGDSSRIETYAVYIPSGSLTVNGGEFNIIGKQVRYGIYDPALITVDGGTLKVDVTRTDNGQEVFGIRQYNNRECHVQNGGVLNISVNTPYDSDGNAGHAKGFAGKTLTVHEGGTATITAKSDWKADSVDLEHITCDGTVNLKAETVNGYAHANASNIINVWGKGTLNVNAQGKFAYPFYNVKFNGTDAAKPLTVTTHAKSTVADGVAYLNNGQVTTTGNVNVTMTVESAVPGARAYGIQNSMSLNHTAGSITLKAAAGTTLETQLTGSVSYDAAKIAVTGNPKGKDFVTFTAISADALLISNTSGGAVTLYQNTELSTDELTFTASGGTAPYTWALTGTLPAGMSLSAAEGAQVKITGKPTAAGSSTFTLTATDSGGKTASATVTITVKTADLVFAGYSTTGIFRDNTLYLPLSSDWATNTHGDEKLNIKSVSGDIDKKLTSAESTGVLRCYAGYSDYINHWIRDTDPRPKVGDTGTITVTLRKDMDTVIATYTYNYEFVKDNPRYLTVGSRKFPAMLENASGTGSKGSWSWDCATSTLTLDNYEGTNGNSLVWADRKFSGLTVIYKGNVVADGVRYFNDENLPGLTYKPFDGNATLTMKQQSSYYKDYGVGADITFEGGNVTLYPRRRLVDPTKSEKVYVKDVKQFIISDVWLYNDETLGADVVVPQYTTDYWLYKAENDRVMSCGSAVPAIESVKIEGADTVSQSGSIALTAQVFPTWLPDAKMYSSATNEEQGAAFGFEYHWYSGGTELAGGAGPGITTSASNLFGTTPAVGAEKTVKCTAQLKFGGSSSATVTSADHTVTVVADGVKVSGKVTSYNGKNGFTVTLYEAGTKTVKHTATISGTGTSGQVTQDFNLDTVAAGEYDLVVTKAAHLPYTVKNVKVEGTDLDLTKLTDKPYSTITLLAGDVNGDEKINSTDTTFIRYPSNFNKSVTSPGVDAIADINGDGKINSTDTTIVRYPENFNKNAGTHCTVQY